MKAKRQTCEKIQKIQRLIIKFGKTDAGRTLEIAEVIKDILAQNLNL